VAEHPDIIEQGQGRLSGALPGLALALPRRAVIATVAGTAAAVLIASLVVVAVRPWAGAALPDPCELLPAATVTGLVPAATGGAPAVFTSRTATTEMCTWRTTSGTLLSLDVEYASSKGLARQAFSALPDAAGPVLAATIRPVPGIGDQAQAVIDTGSPGQMAIYVRVLSGPDLLAIGYNSAGTGLGLPPGDEAIVAKLVKLARTALSRLAATPVPRLRSVPVSLADNSRAAVRK
jgi:hypothetical protein